MPVPLLIRDDAPSRAPRRAKTPPPVAAAALVALDNPKLRGAFYTSAPIAEFLANWAIQDPSCNVLEPSAGDGAFVEAASRCGGSSARIVAVEYNATEAQKIAERVPDGVRVVCDDFFSWYLREQPTCDAVVGNPPFIRYQDFAEAHRQSAFAVMQAEGLHPSRLTNAWVPFVVAATRALRQGGRLAFVVPAELMQVSYAAELREYLVRSYTKLTVVTFRKLVFDGIQQETVLLLGERGGADSKGAKINFIKVTNADDLASLKVDGRRGATASLDHAREKWTQYYLSSRELDLIRALEGNGAFRSLKEYAEVDVGIVTGRNEFFVLTQSEARERGLLSSCEKMVGRSAQIPGLRLSRDDWQRVAAADTKCYLLSLGDVPREKLSAAALSYVANAEKLGHHRGYKCALRAPNWWKVPSLWNPDAFLLRQIHDGPRMIVNQARVTCTDTIHRVRVRPGVSVDSLAIAAFNSLTFAFAEIRGRSYGGGVLELEPTEAEGLLVPTLETCAGLGLDDLDARVRQDGVEAVLPVVDQHVLGAAGLDRNEIGSLRAIWKKLADRRNSRH